MTTLVIRDGVLAVDRRLWSSGRATGRITKVGLSKDGWVVTGAGEAALLAVVLKHVKTRELGNLKKWKPPIADDKWSETCVIMMSPKGEVWFFEGYTPIKWEADVFAEGSGQRYAIGAVRMGASAVEAVRVAALDDPATGDGVNWIKAGGKKIQWAPIEMPGQRKF